MTPEQVIAAQRRAQDVISGFSVPKAQNARDVLTCTAYIASLEHSKMVLERALQSRTPAPPKRNVFDEIFGENFGTTK